MTLVLLVELDDLHDCLGVLLLLLAGDTCVLEELLPLSWEAGELARACVEADMGEVDGVVRRTDFRPFGRRDKGEDAESALLARRPVGFNRCAQTRRRGCL